MITEHLLTVNDESAWQQHWPASHNVFGSIEYARIVQQHSGNAAYLCVIQANEQTIAYPYSLRPIKRLPFAVNFADDVYDALTPEFTGPITNLQNTSGLASDFAERLDRIKQEQGVVTEFAHLHPWQASLEHLAATGISFDREIVYVNLLLPLNQLWSDAFTYACRKNINRAAREQVRVFTATQTGDVREFHKIYLHTMDRNNAQEKYYFSLDYFLAFFEQMPEHARFVLAEYKGQIVAATLYLHDNTDVYSYLGGADQAFQQVRPTNAVVYDTIQWAHQAGKQRLILGGGYEPDDGIFRFKASFSPLRARFQVYRHINSPVQYHNLCAEWEQYYGMAVPSNGYFPAYRTIPHGVEKSE